MRCSATTTTGERCSRATTGRLTMCGQHDPKRLAASAGNARRAVVSMEEIQQLLGPLLADLGRESTVRAVRGLLDQAEVERSGSDYSLVLLDGRIVQVRLVAGDSLAVLTHRPERFEPFSWAGRVWREAPGRPWHACWGHGPADTIVCDGRAEGIRVLVERWHSGVGWLCQDCQRGGLEAHEAAGPVVRACESCATTATTRWCVPVRTVRV